ncbi:MAG: DMT family transporter [Proteobacteria bacterium]|nr:DMT family transporter [Pseudomonadota bacterium]
MKPLHVAIALGVCAIGGFQFIVVKAGVEQFPPILFAFARFGVVVAILWPFLKIVRGRMREIAIISVFFGLLHYPLMFIGLKLSVGVSSVAVAIQLYAPFSVLIAALLLRERVGWQRMLGMALAFSGVVVIGFEPSVFARLPALLMVITSAPSMGIAIVMISRTGGIPILTLQAWLALFSLARCCCCLSCWKEILSKRWSTPRGWSGA